MGNPSLIASALLVDPPFQLTASWRASNSGIDPNDRQYIDNQIRGCEQHLQDSLLSGQTCTWPLLDGASVALAPGDCYTSAASTLGTVTKALASPLAAAGTMLGVAMASAAPGSRFRGAQSGFLPASVTGLGAGSASPVIVNTTTGRMQRSGISGGAFPVGWADAAGNVILCLSPAVGFLPPSNAAITPYVAWIQTTNVTTAALLPVPFPDNTLGDIVGTVVARNNSNNGDAYRADFRVTYQRFGGASPSLVGSAFAASAVVTVGGGSTWGGISLAVIGNSVVIQWTGIAATTINVAGQAQLQAVQ